MAKRKKRKETNFSKIDIYDLLFDAVEMDDLKSGDPIEVTIDEDVVFKVRVVEDDEGEVTFI